MIDWRYTRHKGEKVILDNPSLFNRLAAGKLVGLIVGLVFFFTIPLVWPSAELTLRWGVLLWYPLVGAVIGLVGIYRRHPVLQLPMPWWVRAPLVGAWMNFVLAFFCFPVLVALYQDLWPSLPAWAAPLLLALEGAVVGAIIGAIATHVGGDGPETVTADQAAP